MKKEIVNSPPWGRDKRRGEKGGMMSTRQSIILPMLLVCLVLLPGCQETKPPDGDGDQDQEFNQETFANALATLVKADTIYDQYSATEGDSAAVESLVEWFNQQANVDTARICIDWWTTDIIFNNGLGARYHTESLDTELGYSPDYEKIRFHKVSALDTYLLHARAYIFAPFSGQRQNYNAAQLIYDTLEHFGYDAYLYRGDSDTVTVDLLQDCLANNPGIFAIFTHGSVSPDSGDTVVFWTNERVTDTTRYWSLLDGGEIKIGRSRGRHSYYLITPLFVANHARFRHPGIAYIGGCQNGVNRTMADAFLNAGAKAYLSFSTRIRFDHCFQVTRDLFNFLADTSSVQQAYDNLPANRGLVLFTNTHAEYMIGPNFACGLHNTRDHITPDAHHSTLWVEGQPRDAITTSGAVCQNPLDADTLEAVNLVCLRTPGTHTVSAGHCVLVYQTLPKTKDFGAALGCMGVSGQVHLFACGPVDSFAVGSYSGTLGWWAPGHRPDSMPPDETIQVSGYFKVLVKP